MRGQSCYGEDLLYSRLSPKGKSYYIASFPGGKLLWGKNCYATPVHPNHVMLCKVFDHTCCYIEWSANDSWNRKLSFPKLLTTTCCWFYEKNPSHGAFLVPKEWDLLTDSPVSIRVSRDPPHSLVCRTKWLNWAVLRIRPKKPRSRVTAGVAR
jgi:hypothetical protein